MRMAIILSHIQVSSFRSQLECWNIGTLEYWVLGKWKVGLL
jgi:hypothetical protein